MNGVIGERELVIRKEKSRFVSDAQGGAHVPSSAKRLRFGSGPDIRLPRPKRQFLARAHVLPIRTPFRCAANQDHSIIAFLLWRLLTAQLQQLGGDADRDLRRIIAADWQADGADNFS